MHGFGKRTTPQSFRTAATCVILLDLITAIEVWALEPTAGGFRPRDRALSR